MNILFAGESIDCRHLVTATGRIKPGDILVLGDKLLKVETNQRDCVRIENLRSYFTQWILVDEIGRKHYTRSLFGKLEVYRPKGKRVA